MPDQGAAPPLRLVGGFGRGPGTVSCGAPGRGPSGEPGGTRLALVPAKSTGNCPGRTGTAGARADRGRGLVAGSAADEATDRAGPPGGADAAGSDGGAGASQGHAPPGTLGRSEQGPGARH